MDRLTPSREITDEVTSWDGVESGYGRRGEFAFKVRGREIGHLHGDHAAHFFFPKDVWATLFNEERIAHHPVFPGREGPAARRIETPDDVQDVIALMRVNYDRSARAAGATVTNPSAMKQKQASTPISPGGASSASRDHRDHDEHERVVGRRGLPNR